MNDVLRDMLTLAQGEALSGITKVNADVSKIADGICLQFDAVAFEKTLRSKAVYRKTCLPIATKK